jgi:hypothetical protein
MGLESKNKTLERNPIKDGSRGPAKYMRIIRNKKTKTKQNLPCPEISFTEYQ